MLYGGFALYCACDEPPAPDRQLVTQYATLRLFDHDQICRGQLDAIDAQIERVAEVLDLDVPDDPATFRIEFGPRAVARCWPGDLGCLNSFSDATLVMADAASINAMLVRGLRFHHHFMFPEFFNAGIAEVLSANGPHVVEISGLPLEYSPKQLARGEYEEFGATEQLVAAHFMAWLWHEYGAEAVAGFLRDPTIRQADAVNAAFMMHFGTSLSFAEFLWQSSADLTYTFGTHCDPDRALAWQGDRVTWATRLACDAPGVYGSIPGRALLGGACFEVAEAGEYRVEVEAGCPCATADVLGLLRRRNTLTQSLSWVEDPRSCHSGPAAGRSRSSARVHWRRMSKSM